VAVVQYTFTYKQYRERHKTNNAENNTKIREKNRIPSDLTFKNYRTFLALVFTDFM